MDYLAKLTAYFAPVVRNSSVRVDETEMDVENQCFAFLGEGLTSDIGWLIGVVVLLAFIVAIVHHVVTKGESGEAFRKFLKTQLKAGLQAAHAVRILMRDILKASVDVTMAALSPAVVLVMFVVRGVMIVWGLFPSWESIKAMAGEALRLLLVPVKMIGDRVRSAVVRTSEMYSGALGDISEATASLAVSGRAIVDVLRDHSENILTQGQKLAGGMLKVVRVPAKFFDLLLGNTLFSMIFTSLVSMLVIYLGGGKPGPLKHFLYQVTSSLVMYPDHQVTTMALNMLSTAYGFYTYITENLAAARGGRGISVPNLGGVAARVRNPILIIVVWIVLMMVVIAGSMTS
jgi:hypothetical protein